MTEIKAAGYIVFNRKTSDAIYGTGKTRDEAWQSFLTEMEHGRVWLVLDGEEEPQGTGFERASDYEIAPATQALIDLVENVGGNVPFPAVGGVYCTEDEEESQDQY